MPDVFYRCSKCHAEHDTHDVACECEQTHLAPTEVYAKEYTHWPLPYSVVVVFPNQERVVYVQEV